MLLCLENVLTGNVRKKEEIRQYFHKHAASCFIRKLERIHGEVLQSQVCLFDLQFNIVSNK